jgi:hypothetical protein
MGKTQYAWRTYRYIFDDAGNKRDQLEQTILSEFQAKQYPLKATVKEIKSGGFFFGSKEQCVVIEIDKQSQIAISSTAVGTYLYIEAYLMAPDNATSTDDVFKEQKRNAVFNAAKEIMESAFCKLLLKQSNSGYKSE